MEKEEYALKLSAISNVSYGFIIQITRISVFSSKDLYDFYCMTMRFPTIEEMDTAFSVGAGYLYTMIKSSLKTKKSESCAKRKGRSGAS